MKTTVQFAVLEIEYEVDPVTADLLGLDYETLQLRYGNVFTAPPAFPFLDAGNNKNGRLEGRPWVDLVAGAGFEPAIFRL